MDGRILVVEDEPQVRAMLTRVLGYEGFVVDQAPDGVTARAAMRRATPDLVLLDLLLPDIDGIELCRELRASGERLPILMLTARDTVGDRVGGLDAGADDYLVKPFSMKELVARVRAAARRGVRVVEPARGEVVRVGELVVDPANVQAFVGDVSCELTPTEFRLLYVLALEAGRVVSRDELLQRVWGRRMSTRDRTVDVFVRKLREKVDGRSEDWTFLHTRYGVGYKLEAVRAGEVDAADDSPADLSSADPS